MQSMVSVFFKSIIMNKNGYRTTTENKQEWMANDNWLCYEQSKQL